MCSWLEIALILEWMSLFVKLCIFVGGENFDQSFTVFFYGMAFLDGQIDLTRLQNTIDSPKPRLLAPTYSWEKQIKHCSNYLLGWMTSPKGIMGEKVFTVAVSCGIQSMKRNWRLSISFKICYLIGLPHPGTISTDSLFLEKLLLFPPSLHHPNAANPLETTLITQTKTNTAPDNMMVWMPTYNDIYKTV